MARQVQHKQISKLNKSEALCKSIRVPTFQRKIRSETTYKVFRVFQFETEPVLQLQSLKEKKSERSNLRESLSYFFLSGSVIITQASSYGMKSKKVVCPIRYIAKFSSCQAFASRSQFDLCLDLTSFIRFAIRFVHHTQLSFSSACLVLSVSVHLAFSTHRVNVSTLNMRDLHFIHKNTSPLFGSTQTLAEFCLIRRKFYVIASSRKHSEPYCPIFIIAVPANRFYLIIFFQPNFAQVITLASLFRQHS